MYASLLPVSLFVPHFGLTARDVSSFPGVLQLSCVMRFASGPPKKCDLILMIRRETFRTGVFFSLSLFLNFNILGQQILSRISSFLNVPLSFPFFLHHLGFSRHHQVYFLFPQPSCLLLLASLCNQTCKLMTDLVESSSCKHKVISLSVF